MDQLKNAMSELSVKTVAMPAKRPPGSSGVKAEFLTNLTKLTLKPNVPFFKYDVRMYVVYKGKDGREHLKELTKQTRDDFPEQDRKASAVVIYKHLIKSYPDIFAKNCVLFYDRASVLFSAQAEIKIGQEKEFLQPISLLADVGEGAEGIRVVIKKVTDGFQVTSNDLLKAVNVRDIERDRSILEVLNLAMSQEGYLETSKFVVYGSGVHYLFDHRAFGFGDDELPELMDGKYMGVGLSKGVKVLEGEGGKSCAFVVTDVTKSSFHVDEQNLLEKLSQMSIFFNRQTGTSTFSVDVANRPHNVNAILQLIKGLYVRTLYGKRRTFPVGSIGAAANALRFHTADGNQYTVEQYFKKQYNIQLKYPALFTVAERRKPQTFYPVELLSVAPSQRVTLQQQSRDDVASLIKASATLPRDRLNQTRNMKNALGIAPGNHLLEAAGIIVDRDFTKVFGRVLSSPTIVRGGSSTATVDNCKWSWDRARFIQPANLSNWAVCVTLLPNELNRVPIKKYIALTEERCRSHGMQVQPAAEVFYLKRQTYEGLKKWYAEQKVKSRKYLMFITSDVIQQHDLIKLLEMQYQIVSQEIKSSKVDAVVLRKQHQTLDNVVAKINEKIGGINYNIVLDLTPKYKNYLSDNGVLFVGFEICNPPALSKTEIERGAKYKMPSVLGWGANCSSNPQHFIGDYVYVEARQSDMIGSKLGEVIGDIVKRHRGAKPTLPRHIILYFSGISEGQFSMVCDTYMRAINTGLSSFSPRYEPNVTALVVSKDHNERIYNSNITGKRAADQNIPGGAVIDTKIVSPVINEFYLNAHSAFQGTSKTPKYSLVADNSEMPLDVIEGITYGLCHLHEIIAATVSLPVPLIVADRCAKRGHNVYLANLSYWQWNMRAKETNCLSMEEVRFFTASQNSDGWFGECESIVKLSSQCHAPDDRSIIYSAYLDVLEDDWRHHYTGKSKLLTAVEKGLHNCPHDSSFIRRCVNTCSHGQHRIRLRRLFSTGISTVPNPLAGFYRSLTLIYLEEQKAMKLQDSGVPIRKDVVAMTARSEASRRWDPALWRPALAYAKSMRCIDETHVLASDQRGWARHSHIDYIALSGSCINSVEIINLMKERGSRVFSNLDYMDVLKQANVSEETSADI